MRIFWLIPFVLSSNPLVTSQEYFMACERNEIARAITEIGHEVTAVLGYTLQPVDMLGFSHVRHFRIRGPRALFKLCYHLKILHTVFTNEQDVLFFGVGSSHLIPFSKAICLVKRRKPVLIFDIRSIPVDLDNRPRSKFALFRYTASLKMADMFCDGLTCITPLLGVTLKPKLSRLKEKIGYFQTAVNFETFDPSKASSLRGLLRLENRFIVLYHGVLSPNRGLQNVIRAISLCRKYIPNILFLIVGVGDAERKLRNMTLELTLENNVLFTGGVPFEEVPNYIKTADLGIVPLPNIEWWNVSSPIKLKEYLAMQLPVIATDIPAHRLVIEKAGGGTLVKSHFPQDIADAILTFYRTRQTTYPMKPRSDLFRIISYNSQAHRLVDYINSVISRQASLRHN